MILDLIFDLLAHEKFNIPVYVIDIGYKLGIRLTDAFVCDSIDLGI